MTYVLGKTVGRTKRFLCYALAWRESERQYAPIAWCLVAGWIWLLANLRADPEWPEIMLSALYLSATLAATCAIDARYGIIPDSLVAAFFLGGVSEAILVGQPDRLIEAAAFFLAACIFRSSFRRMRGYHGLGFGDVKFATAGVLWIGIGAVPMLLIAAVFSALTSLLILRAEGHGIDRKQAISFGPHLAIGFWLIWIAETARPGS